MMAPEISTKYDVGTLQAERVETVVVDGTSKIKKDVSMNSQADQHRSRKTIRDVHVSNF